MGFKAFSEEELKTKMGFNFIGIPMKHISGTLQSDSEVVKVKRTKSRLSELIVAAREYLDIHYKQNGKLKSIDGYGNISIQNNSQRDRVWDASLKTSETQLCSLESESEIQLGIFEPNMARNIKYNLIKLDNFSKHLSVEEKIDVFCEEVIKADKKKGSQNQLEIKDEKIEELHRNLLLTIGKENQIFFTITIQNTSQSLITQLKLSKTISKELNDIKHKNKSSKGIRIEGNIIEWEIKKLNPGEKKELIISASIKPHDNRSIRTGIIEITSILEDHLVSGLRISDFRGYSHAMHVINKSESANEAGLWQCSLLFENHSTFPLILKSINVKKKENSESMLDLTYDQSSKIIRPGKSFISEAWEDKDIGTPKYSRRVDYSISSKINNSSHLKIYVDDDIFETIGIQVKKEFLEKEIKTFEESTITGVISVKNIGSVSIKKLIIKDKVPADFIPEGDLKTLKATHSLGELIQDRFEISVDPPDQDASNDHFLKIRFNDRSINAIDVNDFIELSYLIRCVKPNHLTLYEFPVEIETFYSKYKNHENTEFISFKKTLPKKDLPIVNVLHERRNISVGKGILAGRTEDEFAITIVIKNNSNVKVKDVKIVDSFPLSFSFVSSSIDNELSENEEEKLKNISFAVMTLHPHQTEEIIYYLKNTSGKNISFSELESYFYG